MSAKGRSRGRDLNRMNYEARINTKKSQKVYFYLILTQNIASEVPEKNTCSYPYLVVRRKYLGHKKKNAVLVIWTVI